MFKLNEFFLIFISGLGQIPKVAFVLDTEYLYLQQMDQLFAELEKQPGKRPALCVNLNLQQVSRPTKSSSD